MGTVVTVVFAVVVVALVLGALWMIKKRPPKPLPGEEPREHIRYTMKDLHEKQPALFDFDFENENPAYLAMTPDEYEAFSKQFEEVINAIGEGYHATAYGKLQEFLDKVSKADRATLAKGLVLCAQGLCKEKRPLGVLEVYDKLAAEGPGIQLIYASNLGPELSDMLMRSLENEGREFTRTKTTAHKLAEFLRLPHPLVKSLSKDWAERLVRELNLAGRAASGDAWQEREAVNPALKALEAA